MTVRAVASGKGRVRTGRVGAQGPGGGGGGASPVLYTYDFVANPTLPATFSLSRATTGTRFNSSGTLVTEAINAARFHYAWNGSAWVAAGLLNEEQRTNQVLQSNNFSDAAWTKDSGGSITSTTRAAPDGTNTASTFTGAGRIFQLVAGGGPVDWADAIWIRRRTGIGTINMWTPTAHAVDITSQVTGTWTRISTTEATGSAYLLLELVTSGDEIDIFGAQVELGAFSTSYIPTTSAAVTRSADFLSAAGALVAQLAAGPSVWELTDLATGVISRASFAAGAFAFPNNKLYRSMGVYPSGTDTTPYLTVGGPY